MSDPVTSIAKSELETMYYHQAIKHQDQKQIWEAVVKEFNNHTKRRHWKVLPIKEFSQEPG